MLEYIGLISKMYKYYKKKLSRSTLLKLKRNSFGGIAT